MSAKPPYKPSESGRVSSPLLWSRDVPCPKCHAEVGARCRSLTTGRGTDTHSARAAALYDARRGNR